MCPQLIQCNILAYFYAGLDFYTHLFDNVNLRLHNVFFQFKGGNAIHQHTASLLIFLKYSRTVTFLCQIKCTGKSRGACADNGYLLRKFSFQGRHYLPWHIPGLRLQILLCNKTFDLVNRNRLVNRASRTGLLASAVTDVAADCWKRILFLNEGKRIPVSALRRHSQITLHGNVCRASRLTGCRSRIVAIDTVLIAIVLRPHMGSPLYLRGKWLLGIVDLTAVFFT